MRKSIHSPESKVFLGLLRSLREEKGLSQIELAAKLDETQSFVSKCERGERRLDVLELRQFCRAMGVPLEEFALRLDRALK